jgi:hypothetical protein
MGFSGNKGNSFVYFRELPVTIQAKAMLGKNLKLRYT